MNRDKNLVCWVGKESLPSHWRIQYTGLTTGIHDLSKEGAKKAAASQKQYDLSGRQVGKNHKGLVITKQGKSIKD